MRTSKNLGDEEVKKVIERRILRDSEDKEIFKGCKLKKRSKTKYEVWDLEQDSFERYIAYNVDGYVEVLITIGDGWLYRNQVENFFRRRLVIPMGR